MKLDQQLTDEQLSLKLFIVLSRALESVKKQVVKDIKRYELNLTEFAVLELLYHKGRQPLQQIGNKILLASGSITYVVDKLEKRNFLARVSCPTDRRVTYAEITDLGSEFMDKLFPEHEQNIHELLGVLTAEEKQTAIELLKN